MPSQYEKKKAMLSTVEEEKNELAIKVLSLKDKTLVHAFNVIFDDLTSTAKKTGKAQYNKEIDATVKRVRNGKSVSNDQVMNEMEQW